MRKWPDDFVNRIICGDCLEIMKEMPDNSINCIVTSPPYWGLRDYGFDGQIGLEPTPELYIQHLVEIFQEVKRVLRKDGIVFLNLGDSYAGSWRIGTNKRPPQSFVSASIRHVPLCDTFGKVPQGCPLHDSIWNRPCDGCQAVSILRKFDKGRSASAVPYDDSRDPNQRNTESERDHFPTSDSSRQKQILQSCIATPGQLQTQGPVVEPLRVSLASTTDEFSEQYRGGCSHLDNCVSSRSLEYSSSADARESVDRVERSDDTGENLSSSGGRNRTNRSVCPYLHSTMSSHNVKPKDLVGIPWRVAFALQADGWWLRSDIIWAKPNPMPESVTDRPTRSHEYVFLLAKSGDTTCWYHEVKHEWTWEKPEPDYIYLENGKRKNLWRGHDYYFDQEAVKEPSITNDIRRPYTSNGAWELDGRPIEQRHGGEPRGRGGKSAFRGQGAEREGDKGPANRDGRDMRDVGVGTSRNIRSVWTIATQSFKGAHFATFPEKLVEPCIKAGCPVGGMVLDPFIGSGTTAFVATKLGKNYIGIDAKSEYTEMAERRLAGVTENLFKEAVSDEKTPATCNDSGEPTVL